MATPQQLQLLAPLSGVLMPLDQVPDPVFSEPGDRRRPVHRPDLVKPCARRWPG